MSYLILGAGILIGALLAGRWFLSTEPRTLVKVLKWMVVGAVGVAVVLIVLTGRFAMLLWAAPVLLPWIMRARIAARTAKNSARMSGYGTSGRTSDVDSAFLSMQLNHDSGDMDGVIRKGAHAGRRLSELEIADLMALHDTYAREDRESLKLLAAYLDRTYPDWRTGHENQGGSGGDDIGSGPMSRSEALRVLGLPEDAVDAEIKAAHHRLIAGLHPDRGGSAYLSAKINEARDVLLKS